MVCSKICTASQNVASWDGGNFKYQFRIKVKKNDKSMQRELNTNFWWPRLLHNQSLFIALQGGRGVEDIGRDHMVFSGNRGRTSRRLKAMKGNHGKLTTNEEGGRGGDHKKFAEPYGGHVT